MHVFNKSQQQSHERLQWKQKKTFLVDTGLSHATLLAIIASPRAIAKSLKKIGSLAEATVVYKGGDIFLSPFYFALNQQIMFINYEMQVLCAASLVLEYLSLF